MNFFQKSISDPKHKTNEHHRIPHICISLIRKILPKKKKFRKDIAYLSKKVIFELKEKKRKYPSSSGYSSLYSKSQIKPKILICCTEFAQKRYFQSKMERLNITIEVCILNLI